MKALYSVIVILAIVTLMSCSDSRIATIQDRDGIERQVKTVPVGSRIFPSSHIIYSGRSGNMVYFNAGHRLSLPYDGAWGPYGYTNQYAYDLSNSDTLNISGHSIRVIGSSTRKLMYIDYTHYITRSEYFKKP